MNILHVLYELRTTRGVTTRMEAGCPLTPHARHPSKHRARPVVLARLRLDLGGQLRARRLGPGEAQVHAADEQVRGHGVVGVVGVVGGRGRGVRLVAREPQLEARVEGAARLELLQAAGEGGEPRGAEGGLLEEQPVAQPAGGEQELVCARLPPRGEPQAAHAHGGVLRVGEREQRRLRFG